MSKEYAESFGRLAWAEVDLAEVCQQITPDVAPKERNADDTAWTKHQEAR